MIKVGSDFSGVGAFNQALKRLGIEYKEVFACDMDKYARQTFIHNYGEPEYYPENVYDREIPKESLDIYMTSPPCQAFSMAGKRMGKEDKRGILFFNSYEFIQTNRPRYFIFENVKGLLSDDDGRTFSEWVNLLGGKSVNGMPVIFPYEEAVPYHLYWKVLNAKNYGVPQNRERVFLIGIRDDKDNNFRFPMEEHLAKRLKDVLQDDVPEKYFLSEKMVNVLAHHGNPIIENQTPENSACIQASYFKMGGRDQQYLKVKKEVIRKFGVFDNENSTHQAGSVYDTDGLSPTLDTGQGGWRQPCIECTDENKKEYNDKRLNKTIKENPLPEGKPMAIDLYNQKVQENCPTLLEPHHNTTRLWDGYKIRKLTPRECFRLMDFPDTFTWTCSDTQAYKQAGNSIVVGVLYRLLKNMNL